MAAHWQCDGGVAADEAAGGAMAGGRLRGGTAVVVLTYRIEVVGFVDFKW